MPIARFREVGYLPLLDVRPAELYALEQLPNKDKDALLPLFKLRPWVGARFLESAVLRINSSFGTRPCFLELGEVEPVAKEKRRDVHDELDSLRVSHNGFENWVRFFKKEGNEHFIPVAQLSDPHEYDRQIRALLELGRGVLLRLPGSKIEDLQQPIKKLPDQGSGVVVVLDYGKQSSRFVDLRDRVVGHVRMILKNAPRVERVAISASSFPDVFVNVDRQPIYERQLFMGVRSEGDIADRVVYSDRGSARAEKGQRGGGLPAPRIDYPLQDEWLFFRQSEVVADASVGYQNQAIELKRSDDWDSKLKLWGCQMIEKTALGDDTGIVSASRSTAARINIHLHRQLWFGDEDALYATDEEWVD